MKNKGYKVIKELVVMKPVNTYGVKQIARRNEESISGLQG